MKVDISKWELKTLGDVCTFKRGLTYPKSEESAVITSNVVLRSNNIDLNTCALVFNELKYLSDSYTIPNERKLVKDSILMCMSNGSSAHIGKVAYVDNDYDYAFGGFMGLIIPKEINPKFLYYKYRSESFKTFLGKIGNGINITNLKFSSISPLPIYVPSIAEQNFIVEELNALQTIINGYKAQLEDLDALAQSIFLDMFGDPVSNPKGLELHSIASFGKIVTGNTPSKSVEEYYNSDYIEWIKTDNIQNNDIYPTVASEYLSEEGSLKGRIVAENSLLICCIAGSLHSIGKCCITNRKVAFNQQINAIECNAQHNYLFSYWLIKCAHKIFMETASTGMKHILSKSVMSSIKLPVPNLSLQQQFASRIETVEKQKQLVKSQLVDAEQLMAERMQYYFS